MGYIYMADVVTFDGLPGIKVGRTNNINRRLSAHLSDPQWRQFNLMKVWTVRDEVAAESSLLTQLGSYARPIHGNETFCHSINPVRITRMAMGDVVGDCFTSRSWWEVEKFWNSMAHINNAYSGRRGAGIFNIFVFMFHLVALAVCAVWAAVVGIIGIVEHIAIPVASYLMNKWKERVATKEQAALERAIGRFNDTQHN